MQAHGGVRTRVHHGQQWGQSGVGGHPLILGIKGPIGTPQLHSCHCAVQALCVIFRQPVLTNALQQVLLLIGLAWNQRPVPYP